MYAQMIDLLRLLLSQTAARKVEWELFPDEEMVRARVAGGYLRIGRETSQLLKSADGRVLENPVVYLVWVIDSRGQVSDEFMVTPLDQDYALAEELFTSAKSTAKPTTRLLEEMIDSLRR